MKKRSQTKLLQLPLLTALFLSLILPTPHATVMGNLETEKTQASPFTNNNSPFQPVLKKPLDIDQDNNRIADTLDHEITSRLLNKTASEYVNIIVMLKVQPTTDDANAFTSVGGYPTTSPWIHALYGFGGQIPYNQIASFLQLDSNVLLVEKEQTSRAHVAYASKQIGARTYVWNTLGLQGDPQSSIAIVDTGIDDSHPDFSPGFGDQDFSKKIVGWNDQITPATITPYDDNGHGSHVSGLAAGNGFFSVDGSGYATATWGANFGAVDSAGTYAISGMMINKTGLVTVKVKWTNTATKGSFSTLSALPLYYGDKSLNTEAWTRVAEVSTPDRDTWYTLTYPVSSTPSGGYDMYHVTMALTRGAVGNLFVIFTVSWPYTPPDDGFPAWTGIAPQTKLVGVKALDYSGSGTTIGLVDALDWIIANRQDYHIVITSMSLGFSSEVTSVDNALLNLVNSGITAVISAGNSGPGSNYIYTPGSVDEVITVAAQNQFDNIVDYSSQGGTSRFTGKTLKPDITAPGGSFLAVPLSSVDSNDWDAEKMWLDETANDAAAMQGTSMSAPIVSGAVSLLVQAMGGFASWQYTRSQALLPKMILLMTATETYPNSREYYTSNSPTLERGGKDVHEGFGRLNLDAAVDSVLKSYEVGTTTAGSLGKPPSLSDVSVLGEKLAWARKVQLNTEGKYNFTLNVPTGADFDMYIYNSTGTLYGEPAIVTKSTSATIGGHEQLVFTAPYNGTYYLLVKRATASTAGGTFTLESTFTPNHDVTVQKVEPSPTSAYEGENINISVTLKNKGLNPESFDVTVFRNTTIMETQTVSNLPPSGTATLNFTWNTIGTTPSKYVIKAQVTNLPNDFNATDNTLSFKGTVQIKILGDVNSDSRVDSQDLTDLNSAFGSTSDSTNWNPECDFNQDNTVNATDLRTLGKNYGKSI